MPDQGTAQEELAACKGLDRVEQLLAELEIMREGPARSKCSRETATRAKSNEATV